MLTTSLISSTRSACSSKASKGFDLHKHPVLLRAAEHRVAIMALFAEVLPTLNPKP